MTDLEVYTILVFNEEGNHLYKIPTAKYPAAEEYSFVSAKVQLAKIRKPNNESVKSVQTEKSAGESTLMETITFTDVSLATDQLLCLTTILNS